MLVVFLQAFLIAVTAQFIPLLVYSYRDPSPETRISSPSHMDDNLQENLGGYVNYSLTRFPIRVLLEDDNNPFPLASAIALNYYFNDNDDEPSEYYFQPYHTNVPCFLNNDSFPGVDRVLSMDREHFAPVYSNGTIIDYLPYFSEAAWDDFTGNYDTDPGGTYHTNYLGCINENYTCRYC